MRKFLILNKKTGHYRSLFSKSETEIKTFVAAATEDKTIGDYEIHEVRPCRILVETKIMIV